jgi:hypothetical protein
VEDSPDIDDDVDARATGLMRCRRKLAWMRGLLNDCKLW